MTTYKPKLIEVALPLATINDECVREKTIRHGHPSTFHLWWARRPLASARAAIFASLVDDPSGHPEQFPTEEAQLLERNRLFDLLGRLVSWEATNDERILEEARAEINRCYPDGLPAVIDPFGGGGSIPLEALRLGLPTSTGDLNPVAVLLQRAMLQFPGRFRNRTAVNPSASALAAWTGLQGLADDIRYYSGQLAKRASDQIGNYYPPISTDEGSLTPIAYMWSRTVESPDPAFKGHVPLVKTWVLRKKPRKPTVWVEPLVDRSTGKITSPHRPASTLPCPMPSVARPKRPARFGIRRRSPGMPARVPTWPSWNAGTPTTYRPSKGRL